MSPSAPNIVICPVPEFMLLRISEGLFFDLAETKGYENPYGTAFETYAGEISELLVNPKYLQIQKGSEYTIKKAKKAGVDWYVFDDSAAMLIECKAKGLKLSARYQLEETALLAEIDLLAKFIVQTYKNLVDIIGGHTNWNPSNRDLHPVVLTLSNWYIFGPSAYSRLEDSILALLERAGLDKDIVNTHPYTIMSIDEYEIAIQIINKIGLSKFFKDRNHNNYKGWMTFPFMQSKYPTEISEVRFDYLRSEIESIIGEMEGNLKSSQLN
jgi:hypothetical protein